MRQNPVGIPRLRSIVCAEVFEDFGAEFVAVDLAIVPPEDVSFGVDQQRVGNGFTREVRCPKTSGISNEKAPLP